MDGTAGDALREVVAFDEFHDERREVGCLLEAVDRGDVRMVERREHFGFALKAREPIRIAATEAGSTLIATGRFRLLSVARYTSPMPPSPIGAVIS